MTILDAGEDEDDGDGRVRSQLTGMLGKLVICSDGWMGWYASLGE